MKKASPSLGSQPAFHNKMKDSTLAYIAAATLLAIIAAGMGQTALASIAAGLIIVATSISVLAWVIRK